MSWNSLFWKTTSPGVTAMSVPISNASGGTCSTASGPLPLARTAARFSAPSRRFSPRRSFVSRSTAGLVSAKLVGDIASTIWRFTKSTFCAVSSSSPSMLSTMRFAQAALRRYACLM